MVVVSWIRVLRRVDERLGIGVGVNGIHCKRRGESAGGYGSKGGGLRKYEGKTPPPLAVERPKSRVMISSSLGPREHAGITTSSKKDYERVPEEECQTVGRRSPSAREFHLKLVQYAGYPQDTLYIDAVHYDMPVPVGYYHHPQPGYPTVPYVCHDAGVAQDIPVQPQASQVQVGPYLLQEIQGHRDNDFQFDYGPQLPVPGPARAELPDPWAHNALVRDYPLLKISGTLFGVTWTTPTRR
ncbi:hypothetical protein BGW80DRAFT_1528928 [Lactifluus volemus]|nr:hypothetical protein BGW80DRAFT_1528928 [Lactifluus volemus]